MSHPSAMSAFPRVDPALRPALTDAVSTAMHSLPAVPPTHAACLTFSVVAAIHVST